MTIAGFRRAPYRQRMADGPDSASSSGLRIAGLSSAVLKGVSLSVGGGEGRAITGPSGSGKTSLFRAIADLDPNEGTVSLSGEFRESVTPGDWRRRVAYVPAEPAWWLTHAGDHADAVARDVADRLGLSSALLEKPVKSLSTGERQRLALAIAFARKPEVLLLDEPTSALDEDNRDEVETLIREQMAGGAALLMASHDPAQLERLGLQPVRIDGGRIVEGAP